MPYLPVPFLLLTQYPTDNSMFQNSRHFAKVEWSTLPAGAGSFDSKIKARNNESDCQCCVPCGFCPRDRPPANPPCPPLPTRPPGNPKRPRSQTGEPRG